MLTFSMLLTILVAAEARLEAFDDPGIRERTQETIDLCNERLRMEGMTRQDLEKAAAREHRALKTAQKIF